MKNKPQEVIGFDFQIIPLQQAQAMAMAGDGNYAELKAKLLEELPNLKPDESFAFGLPKGEVDEKQRRTICTTLNSTLKKAKLPWRFTYSGVKRLFVCVPRHVGKKEMNSLVGSIHAPGSKLDPAIAIKIQELREQKMATAKIANQLQISPGAVNYQVYGKKRKKQAMATHKSNTPLEDLLKIAAKLWNVDRAQLVKRGDRESSSMRKAIQYIAKNKYSMHPRDICPVFNITPDGVYFNIKRIHDRDRVYIAQLEKEIGGK